MRLLFPVTAKSAIQMPDKPHEVLMEPATLNAGQSNAVTRESIHLIKAFSLPGYLPGMGQPCVVVELALASQVSRQGLAALDRLIFELLPASGLGAPLHPSVEGHGLLSRLVSGTLTILDRAGMPLAARPMIVGRREGLNAALSLALPSYGADQATFEALRWVASLMNLALGGQPVASELAGLPELVKKIGLQAPRGLNTKQFLHAAHTAGIPVTHVWRNVFRFGWGSRARLLDSSFTDETPLIAARLARNKQAAALVMRAAGIPVPRHEVAHNADHAVRIAGEFGYPVVVKPADQDGGRGVAAGLPSEQAVRKAFAAARALSGEVLVEQHAEGNDYRLHVHKGEVFWASHRVPGGVTGDGTSTVAQLLEALNADPLRGVGANSVLKRIDLDEEANDLLAEQGLTSQSSPAAGLFVRLRRTANVSRGGVPVPVLHEAHPDNLALAARAARVVGLDLAGVDLLMPDIGRSWQETGAAICEINAQPQYNPPVFAIALQRLVPHHGRIPVVVVLGDEDRGFYQRVADALARLGRPGIATGQEIRVGSQVVSRGPLSVYDAGRALLVDPAVDVAVIGIPDLAVLATGMPVDSFDVLVLAGPMKGGNTAAHWQRWRAFSAELASMCHGSIIVNQDCAEWAAPGELHPNLKQPAYFTYGNLPEAIRQALKPG